MNEMFCYQCEESAKGKGCTSVGVCGKKPEVSEEQDFLTAALIDLGLATNGKSPNKQADKLVLQGLFKTITNVNFDKESIGFLKDQIIKITEETGRKGSFPAENLWEGDADIVSLRSTLLFGLRGMAAYSWHAYILGERDQEIIDFHYKILMELGKEHNIEEWLQLILELGKTNLKCMELLDKANTSIYGNPQPVSVPMKIEEGPFIVVTGHDLMDLKVLLEQTENRNINIYTHGEMLPAHAYPELKKHKHLKGNFGTAWQNQKKEFDNVPGAFLFTTNCIMPPKPSYIGNIFTTGVVGYPGVVHIKEKDGIKDFTPVIEKALELSGWSEDKVFSGINGGTELTTGFGHNAVLGAADKIIDAVKSGAISHFFLVGGCDGAKPGRNYYTNFVLKSPKDSIILTLACGKYRFNDLNIGEIGGLPRIIDMGQCNDAYSAIQVAIALSQAFDCSVNDLPLTLVLSWYEQKAVCILLTLLALDIKNIYIGPSMPAFLSETVLNVLVEKFDLKPITTPEDDLSAIMG